MKTGRLAIPEPEPEEVEAALQELAEEALEEYELADPRAVVEDDAATDFYVVLPD